MDEEQAASRWRPGDGFAPGAWRYALVAFALSIPATVFSPFATLALLVLGVAALLFHRDPDRAPPAGGVLAPADGRVSVIREEGDRVRVGVFMNVTDVHVNRAPLGGRIEAVDHEPGKHRPAFSKESDRNEKVRVRFSNHEAFGDYGESGDYEEIGDYEEVGDYEVTLIAGAFARRIHPYVEPGDDLDRGERLGHVSFGSRADVLLPASVDLTDVVVERGESVRAGETVLVGETAVSRRAD